MKKILAAMLVMLAGGVAAQAQTDFRHISFNEALKAADKEGKLVFVDFYTTWCGPCKMMSAKVFPQPEVGEYMNATFVPLKLDAENEAPDLAKKYGVRAYPTYIVVDAKGEEVAKFSGAMDAPAFIEKLKMSLDPELKPERIRARYLQGERVPMVVNAYAMQLLEDRKEKEGFEVIDSYYDSLDDAARLSPDNLFLFTRYTFDQDTPRARFMYTHLDKFPQSSQPAVRKQLAAVYHNEISKYFSGYMYREGKFDPAVWATLKDEVVKLGLDKENSSYPLMFEFIENRPTMTDAEYLAFCDANYDKLGDQAKNTLCLNIGRLIKPENPELKAGISKFLRSRLATMSPSAIQMAGRTLSSIEGR